jgi:hypothetical protein
MRVLHRIQFFSSLFKLSERDKLCELGQLVMFNLAGASWIANFELYSPYTDRHFSTLHCFKYALRNVFIVNMVIGTPTGGACKSG